MAATGTTSDPGAVFDSIGDVDFFDQLKHVQAPPGMQRLLESVTDTVMQAFAENVPWLLMGLLLLLAFQFAPRVVDRLSFGNWKTTTDPEKSSSQGDQTQMRI